MNKLHNTIIVAPEITKGMKSIGSKALLEVNKKSILDHQIHYLNRYYPHNHICIATGFEHDKIKKRTSRYHNVSYSFNPEYESTNQGKSIELYLKEYDPTNLLIINNGILFNSKLFIPEESTMYAFKKTKPGFNIGFNELGSNVYYVFYDLPKPWAECIFLDNNTIQKLKFIISRKKISQLFLFEILNLLIDSDTKLTSTIINQKDILKINNHKDLNKLKNYEKNICTKH